MDDPLSRALEETTDVIDEQPRTVDRHTEHPHPVRHILEALKTQVLETVTLPFFDGEIAAEILPIRSVGRAECGAIHLSACRRNPPYRAELTIDVRCDLLANDGGGVYHVTGTCVMASAGAGAKHHREFVVQTELDDGGSLQVDTAQIRSEMAAAIQSMGKIASN